MIFLEYNPQQISQNLPQESYLQEDNSYPLPAGTSAHLPGSPSEDFFRFRIDGSDILEDMEHQLKGEILVQQPDGSMKWEEKFDRWINDEGIAKVLHIIYSCGINKNTFLGNLRREQILYKCKMIKKNLARLLMKKYPEYEVDKDMRALLITTVVNTVHSGLSRSEGGRESDQLSTAANRHDIYQHTDTSNQKRGLAGLIPGLK